MVAHGKLVERGLVADANEMEALSDAERGGLTAAIVAMAVGVGLLVLTAFPETSAWRSADGDLAASSAPLMRSIVPLIFLLFIVPGIVYGYVAGTVGNHRLTDARDR